MSDVSAVVRGERHARARERRVDAEARHVGEVQAAHAGPDRDVHALRSVIREQSRRQATTFRTEDEDVVGLERDLEERRAAARAEESHAFRERSVGTGRERRRRSGPTAMDDEVDERPVVEPRALQIAVFEAETERFDEMETQTETGREPRGAARVVRDLGVDEDDFQAAECSVPPQPCSTSRTSSRRRHGATRRAPTRGPPAAYRGPMRTPIAAFLLAPLLHACTTSGGPTAAPEKAPIRAEYRVNVREPGERAMDVELRITGLDPTFDEIELNLPEGYSFIRLEAPLLARPVTAKDAAGDPLAIENLSPFRWTLATNGATDVTVNWTSALTAHDRADVAQRDSFGHPYIAADHATLMTGAFMIAPALGPDVEWRVRFDAPDGWPVLTPWRELEPGVFDPVSRRALQDDLVAVGAWTSRRIEIAGMTIDAAFAPGQPALEALAAPAIERICAAELALFDLVPRERYLFLFVAPKPVSGFTFSGSPKDGAMVLQVCGDLANPIASEMIAHLVAHEFHHLWAVARLDYGDDLRFVGEGFTDWYAYVVPARLGLTTWKQFGESLGKKLDAWTTLRPKLDVALHAAGGPGFFEGGDHYAATYGGGLLVAALLDVELRRAGRTDGLDGWLREFVNDPRYSHEHGPSLEDFLAHVERALGSAARERVARWTTEPSGFDPAVEFERLGVALERTVEPRALRANFEGTRITGIDMQSEAGALGLRAGDVLRSVNGRDVSDAATIQAAWSQPLGSEVEVRAERDGESVVLRASALPPATRTAVDVAMWSEHGERAG